METTKQVTTPMTLIRTAIRNMPAHRPTKIMSILISQRIVLMVTISLMLQFNTMKADTGHPISQDEKSSEMIQNI